MDKINSSIKATVILLKGLEGDKEAKGRKEKTESECKSIQCWYLCNNVQVDFFLNDFSTSSKKSKSSDLLFLLCDCLVKAK